LLLIEQSPAGDGNLPEMSSIFMMMFAIIFGLLSVVKNYASHRQLSFARWIPSGVAFAIGFLNTPSFSLARLIGGIVEYVYHRHTSSTSRNIGLIIIASGFVLGEGVMSIVGLILQTFGVSVASCWGCLHGLCPGCSVQ